MRKTFSFTLLGLILSGCVVVNNTPLNATSTLVINDKLAKAYLTHCVADKNIFDPNKEISNKTIMAQSSCRREILSGKDLKRLTSSALTVEAQYTDGKKQNFKPQGFDGVNFDEEFDLENYTGHKVKIPANENFCLGYTRFNDSAAPNKVYFTGIVVTECIEIKR